MLVLSIKELIDIALLSPRQIEFFQSNSIYQSINQSSDQSNQNQSKKSKSKSN